MKKKEFGKKLQELRNGKGESQLELGNVLGVGIKQIQRYEGGKGVPAHEGLEILCNHYKYDFISLLYGLGQGIENLTEATLQKKLEAKNEKIIEIQDADLKALRLAVNKITSTEKRVDKLESTVDAHQDKWKEYEPIILGLREFVIDEIVSLKKQSREQAGASLNIKVEEQRKVVEQSYTQKG